MSEYLNDMGKTKYSEALAAVILSKAGFLPDKPLFEWLQDSPDLQIGDIGVEVTEAILQSEGNTRGLKKGLNECENLDNALKYWSEQKRGGKQFSVEKDKYHANTYLLHGYVCDSNKALIPFTWELTTYLFLKRWAIRESGGCDLDRTQNLILEAIKIKSNKYTKYSNGSKFSQKWLYIFVDDMLLTTLQIKPEVILKEIESSVFDRVFIYLKHLKLSVFTKGEELPIDISLTESEYHEADILALALIKSPQYDEALKRNTEYERQKRLELAQRKNNGT